MTGHSVEVSLHAAVEMKMTEPCFVLRERVVQGGRQDKYRWKDHQRGQTQWYNVQWQAREHLVEGSREVSWRRWDLRRTLAGWESFSRWKWDSSNQRAKARSDCVDVFENAEYCRWCVGCVWRGVGDEVGQVRQGPVVQRELEF